MNMLPLRAAHFALIAATALVVGSTPANAVTWNLGTPSGDLGSTHTYTVGGFSITAAGFTNSTFSTAVHLYGKNNGGDEVGLGLMNDPTGEHEISGTSLIRIDFSSARLAGLKGFTFSMDSSTQSEGWSVYGSNSAATLYTLLMSGQDENAHTLTGTADTYSFYYFIYKSFGSQYGQGNNVLLTSISAAPLPPAVLLFGTALVGMGVLARRRRKNAVADAQ